MEGNQVAADGAIRPEGPAATPLDEARRNIGRDILAGESGVSALARYAAHVDDRYTPVSWIRDITPAILQILAAITVVIYLESLVLAWLR